MNDFTILNRVINSSPQIISVINGDGIIKWQNKSAMKFFGRNFIGKDIFDSLGIDMGSFKNKKSGMISAPIRLHRKERLLEHRIIRAGNSSDSGIQFIITEDRTEKLDQEKQTSSLLHFENLLTRMALESINIPVDEIDSHINKLLKLLGKFAGVERCYTALYDRVSGEVVIRHDWCSKKFTPSVFSIKRKLLPAAWEKWGQKEIIILADIHKIKYPRGSGPGKIFTEGIKSAMLLPLYCAKSRMGYLGFSTVQPDIEFSDELKSVFKIAAELIINLYERKSAYAQLEISGMIVSKSAGMLAYFDREGIIKSSSEAFQKFYKISGTQAINIIDLFRKKLGPGAGAEKFLESINQSLNGKEIKTEIWFRQDNRIRLMEILLHPDADDSEIRGVVMNSSDITERVQLETRILEVMHQERKRIGITLHDDLGHDLLAVAIKSRLLSDKLKSISQELSADAGHIEISIRNCISEVRNLSHGLIPYKNYGLEFREMLDAAALTIEKNYKVNSVFDIAPDLDIKDESVIKELYYIIDEAVLNAQKHSGCSSVTISMYQEKMMIVLKIVDNGRGISDNTARSGAGIEIMKYRARSIGGLLEIKNNPSGGTIIECTFSKKNIKSRGLE